MIALNCNYHAVMKTEWRQSDTMMITKSPEKKARKKITHVINYVPLVCRKEKSHIVISFIEEVEQKGNASSSVRADRM